MRRIYWIRISVVVRGITNGFHLFYFLYLIGCDVHSIYLFILYMYTYLHLLKIYHGRNIAGNYFLLSYFVANVGCTTSEKVGKAVE